MLPSPNVPSNDDNIGRRDSAVDSNADNSNENDDLRNDENVLSAWEEMLRRFNHSGRLSLRQRNNSRRSAETEESSNDTHNNNTEDANGHNNAERAPGNAAPIRAEITLILNKFQGFLPFLALLLVRFIYIHAIGIIFFIGATVVLLQSENRIISQLSNSSQSAPAKALMVTLSSLIYVWATYTLILVIDPNLHIWNRMACLPLSYSDELISNNELQKYHSLTLIEVFWIVLATDLWARMLTMGLKSIVLPLPIASFYKKFSVCRRGRELFYSQLPPVETNQPQGSMDLEEGRTAGEAADAQGEEMRPEAIKKKIFSGIEVLSLFYRSLLPVPVWFWYYMEDEGMKYFAAIYLTFKFVLIISRMKLALDVFKNLFCGVLECGQYCSKEEIENLGNPDCSICYGEMSRPIKLPCDHMYCEGCLSQWLERESTCPLCRAEVGANNKIPSEYRSGRGSSYPVVF